jgi:hypothetical protein
VGPRWSCVVATLGSALLLGVAATSAHAQQFDSGQNVVPVYDGWERNPDGSFNLVFGYFNRNWAEELDLPAGPDNTIDPGGPDLGQPTHFYPRRSRFIFRVPVPADFGDSEAVWTLTSKGKTERAYATLLPEYFIDKLVISANTGGAGGAGGGAPEIHENEPPTLEVEGDVTRTVKAGMPLSLAAVAHDDGLPTPRPNIYLTGNAHRPGPASATGLRVSWFVYRGEGEVDFSPTQITEWEDSRDGANAPMARGWTTPPAPRDNRWIVEATFDEPGEYVLRCQAHDGALPVAQDITVTVTE